LLKLPGKNENEGVIMKPNKALRRLTKIEASMSDVVERYVTLAPAVRKALRDAMVAVTVAKEAVSLEVSSGTATNPPVEPPALKKAAESTKSVPAKKTASPKKSAVKSSKKAAPVGKTGR
jgi:hypothetical protein